MLTGEGVGALAQELGQAEPGRGAHGDLSVGTPGEVQQAGEYGLPDETSDEHVGQHGRTFDELELLEHHADSGPGGAAGAGPQEVVVLPVVLHVPGGWLMLSCQTAHQGGLSRTAAAEHGDDLTGSMRSDTSFNAVVPSG